MVGITSSEFLTEQGINMTDTVCRSMWAVGTSSHKSRGSRKPATVVKASETGVTSSTS
jgi:hypothetical protein